MNTRIRRAFRIWASAGTGVVAALGIMFGATVAHNGSIHNQIQQAHARQHFWAVVAGRDAPDEFTVANKLGSDLRLLVGPVDGNATRLPPPLTSFRGDPNAYGGITDEIGVDPFVSGGGCNECGPLTGYMQAGLLDVKRGHVDEVIAAAKPSVHERSAAWMLWVLVVYALTFPLYVVAMRLPAARRQRSLEAQYPNEAKMVERLDRAIGQLPPGTREYEDFSRMRERLQRELAMRVSDGTDDTVSERRLQKTKQEASRMIEAMEEGNDMMTS